MLLIGGRMAEMPSQTTLFEIPYRARLSCMCIRTPTNSAGVYHASLAINATPQAFCAQLEKRAASERDRAGAGAQAHADYLGWTGQPPIPGAMQFGAALTQLRAKLGDDFIVTSLGRQLQHVRRPLPAHSEIRRAARRHRARWATVCRRLSA